MARAYRPTKRADPEFYKSLNRLNAEANELTADVNNTISKVLGYREDDAEIFENAARDRFAARDVKKAIKNFEKAADIYDQVSEGYLKEEGNSKSYHQYQTKSVECHRQADRLKRVLKGKWHGLEGKAAAIIGIGGIILGLFFLSPNITGNTIAIMSTKSQQYVAIGFFVVGILAGYYWFKHK